MKTYCKQLIDAMAKTTDQYGRLVAELFLELPVKKDLPSYYQLIKKPIALSSMRRKIKSYTSFDLLEADVKLMVMNAEKFNQPGSPIVDQAKLLLDMFVKSRAKIEKRLAKLKEQKAAGAEQKRGVKRKKRPETPGSESTSPAPTPQRAPPPQKASTKALPPQKATAPVPQRAPPPPSSSQTKAKAGNTPSQQQASLKRKQMDSDSESNSDDDDDNDDDAADDDDDAADDDDDDADDDDDDADDDDDDGVKPFPYKTKPCKLNLVEYRQGFGLVSK